MNKSRRIRWTEHVSSREKKNVYRIFVGKPEGKRPLRRLRRKWENNIKMNLRGPRYGSIEWIDLA
jgi:hypothetical protein